MFEIIMLLAFAAAAFSQLTTGETHPERNGQDESASPGLKSHQEQRPSEPSAATARSAHPACRTTPRSHLQNRVRMLP